MFSWPDWRQTLRHPHRTSGESSFSLPAAGLDQGDHQPQGPDDLCGARKIFIVQPNPWLAQLLKPLPGFDSAGALDQAWKSAQADSNGWRLRDLLPAAAEAGKPDVPAVLIRLLGKSIDPYSVQVARKVTHQSTLAVGKTDDELIAWLKANEANLAFDPATKKFVLKPLPTPAPSAPLPPSSTSTTGK